MTVALVSRRIAFPGLEGPGEGAILIDGGSGKILEAGPGVSIPSSATVHDLGDQLVTPGLIDCHSHVGLIESGGGEAGDDANEGAGQLMPGLRALDGVNHLDRVFPLAIEGGVTAVGILPGPANVVGGAGCALWTGGESLEERIIERHVGMKCALGEAPRKAEAPSSPQTKMAVMALLRQSIADARAHREPKSDERRDLGAEGWNPVFEGRVPIRIHAHRASEIALALALAREFGLALVIEHGTEAVTMAEELVRDRVPVVCNPFFKSPASREELGIDPHQPARLARAGVLVAVSANHPELPLSSLAHLACLARQHGLSWREALESVTSRPAEILRIADRTGALARGLRADLAIWRQDPLEGFARPSAVWVNGRVAWEHH